MRLSSFSFACLAVTACIFSSLTAPAQTNASAQTYAPPFFADKERAKKLAVHFPLVEKLYREYAEKIIFPVMLLGLY